MSYKLFLDDYRQPDQVKWVAMPPGPWVVVKNYKEFVDTVELYGVPEFVAYDHDLAENHYYGDFSREMTGYDAAVWMVAHCEDAGVPHPAYVVHSMNPSGAERIRALLKDRT